MIEEESQECGGIDRIKHSMSRSSNGWGGKTTLSVEVNRKTGEIEHVSMDFNGTYTSGVSLEEIRRFKALLNSFESI